MFVLYKHRSVKFIFQGGASCDAHSRAGSGLPWEENVIYVALDENRKPTPVPPLVPADDEEAAIIERAHIRRMHRQKIDEKDY